MKRPGSAGPDSRQEFKPQLVAPERVKAEERPSPPPSAVLLRRTGAVAGDGGWIKNTEEKGARMDDARSPLTAGGAKFASASCLVFDTDSWLTTQWAVA